MHLLIRADSSPTIGAGHTMRCLALAEAWSAAGGSASFMGAQQLPLVTSALEEAGVGVDVITAVPGGAEDSRELATRAVAAGVDWVVVDGYHFDASYQARLAGTGIQQLWLDDRGSTGPYVADIVLNHGPAAVAELYTDRASHTELLLGSSYTLLREAFRQAPERRGEPTGQRLKLLLSFGGGEASPALRSSLEALRDVETISLDVEILAPDLSDDWAPLRALRDQGQHRVQVLASEADPAARMAQVDLALVAAGGTALELARLGIPALLISVADNQEANAARLAEAGAARHLGRLDALSTEQISTALLEMAASTVERRAFAAQGPRLIDGNGATRVVEAMHAQTLRLRDARAEDARLLFEWTNEPSVRAASFSIAPVPWESHLSWFEARLASAECSIYIFEDADGIPLGQIRYDAEGDLAIVNISVARAARGRGVATKAFRLSARRHLWRSAASYIRAWVKPENQASLVALAHAGYVDDGWAEAHGERVAQMVFRP